METIIVAGGCFWGLEELFRHQPGVTQTEVGYCGGKNTKPTYENHPGHAESLKITFDSSITSIETLLHYFFRIHDPTTKNRQGNDIGESYRSVIFYKNEQQKHIAQHVIKAVERSHFWSKPLVTTLEKLTTFYLAEDYHQNYLQKNPHGYTCHYERAI
jgi:peptide-methionine (S)-S-oxide reductase